MRKADPSKAHGLNGYTNRGCRCEVCRAANTKYNLRRRVERAVDGPKVHGKYTSYTNYSCRCDLCKGAAREQARAWREKRAKVVSA